MLNKTLFDQRCCSNLKDELNKDLTVNLGFYEYTVIACQTGQKEPTDQCQVQRGVWLVQTRRNGRRHYRHKWSWPGSTCPFSQVFPLASKGSWLDTHSGEFIQFISKIESNFNSGEKRQGSGKSEWCVKRQEDTTSWQGKTVGKRQKGIASDCS